MRLVGALIWGLAAGLALLITFGNVAVVGYEQSARSALREADLTQDMYKSIAGGDATRWASACLTEILGVHKELHLNQLDLIYGHAPLPETQRKLAEAHAFLLNFLRCSPSDGTAWLAAAMVMNTMNNDADVTMQYLALSRFYSPRNANAVRIRAQILQKVSPRLKTAYRDQLMEMGPSDAPGLEK